MPVEPRPLRAVVGERVRAIREEAGVRQEDLSAAARKLGLTTWTRTRIAALERGDKAISAEDLIRLLAVLTLSTWRVVELAELFDSSDSIAISSAASVPARSLADILRGKATTQDVYVEVQYPEDIPGSPEHYAAFQRASNLLAAAGRKTLPPVGETRAVQIGMGESDERARRELGMAEYPFETLCLVMWGRSLSAERDARLEAAGAASGSSASVAARRGRLTRALVAEAQARLQELEGGGGDGQHR